MVYYGLTKLTEYYKSLNSGEIMPKGLNIVFNAVEDVEDSFTPYAPAQVQYEIWYPYEYKDFENLPSLEKVTTTFKNWG